MTNAADSLVGFFFCFFVLISMAWYWWAPATAFPERAFGIDIARRARIQMPVECLGARFDSLSFLVTACVVRRAMLTPCNAGYIGHLGIDLLIAALAACRVLFVLRVWGWLVGLIDLGPALASPPHAMSSQDVLAQGAGVQQQRMAGAIDYPTHAQSVKNMYFRVMIGIFAMIPAFIHVSLPVFPALKVSVPGPGFEGGNDNGRWRDRAEPGATRRWRPAPRLRR